MAATSEIQVLSTPAVPWQEALTKDGTSVLDEKHRITIGNRQVRERMGSRFILALGPLGCLCAYPEKKWAAIYEELFSGRQINVQRDKYARLVFKTVEDEVSFDSQGRFVLPAFLRSLTGIVREVMWQGMGDHLEIWDPEEWRTYQQLEDSYGFQRMEAVLRAYDSALERR
jgi:MraZ protein